MDESYSTISMSLGVAVNACGDCGGGITTGSRVDTLWYRGTDPSNAWDLLPPGSSPTASTLYFGPTGRGFACMDHRATTKLLPQRPAL